MFSTVTIIAQRIASSLPGLSRCNAGVPFESALERQLRSGNPVLVVTRHARYFPAKE
jgi:hypothetical protein